MDAADQGNADTDAYSGADAGAGAGGLTDAGAAFAIVVMAKAPIAGLAKTRLIPLLGPAGAARAQRGFVLRTLATAQSAQPEALMLSCAPDRDQRFFRAMRRSRGWPGLRFTSQSPGDVGERMAAVFAEHAAGVATAAAHTTTSAPHTSAELPLHRSKLAGQPDGQPPQPLASTPLLLIGTDCPALTSAHLRAAADALAQGADAVFGPVEDGGYMLVGLRDPSAATRLQLFEGIDWSTERVMMQTRERLRAAHASWHELPLLWDVDEPADWLRWQRAQTL